MYGAPGGDRKGMRGPGMQPTWGKELSQRGAGQEVMKRHPGMTGPQWGPGTPLGTRIPQGGPTGQFGMRMPEGGMRSGVMRPMFGMTMGPQTGWGPTREAVKGTTQAPEAKELIPVSVAKTMASCECPAMGKYHEDRPGEESGRGWRCHLKWRLGGLALLVLVVIPVVVTLFWVLPITLGLWLAGKRNYSRLWMLFGIHPLGGWIACLVLALSKGKVECGKCGAYVKRNFRQCPQCHSPVGTGKPGNET